AGGLGGIIANKKNISIINDTLTLGRITACKHANGRDWWVVVHRANSDQYYKMLITPDTILTSSQSIGGVIRGGLSDVAGQALFSPDGAKYALLTYDTTMYVMDFDRCTGDFSNGVMVTIPDTNLATVGCAFSPNSRFLYVSNNQHVFQFDTWAGASMPSTKTIVATYDGFISGLHSTFFMMQLAPDNKIYISTSQGTNVLHVINDPDQPGLSCNLVQHQLRLPSYNAEALPNAPNYDLGALTGSVCDSLPHVGIIELADQQDLISVFPNPSVTGIFYFQLNESPDQIKNMEILDVTGRLIDASKKNLYEVDISSSAGGIYFYSIQTKSGKIIKGKLVKE
ncbi:MAG: T9SS type A sorting domain-containing protein, partial [Bacteroidetes bacterium]|nr:T9SS type A sorting domain-containing protein [Bacteroidota bacterium]